LAAGARGGAAGPAWSGGPAGASASGRAESPQDAEAGRVIAAFAAGASIHDLAAGTTNPGDRRYKAARMRVEGFLRRLAAGRGSDA